MGNGLLSFVIFMEHGECVGTLNGTRMTRIERIYTDFFIGLVYIYLFHQYE